jgi:NAD(P)-dependent dehydrogenase (short-subunit alcohol dehydrogenase family)
MMDILITGSSRGIGFYLAETLAKDGHRVFATARKVEGALKQLSEKYRTVLVSEMDVTSEKGVKEEAKRIADQFGGLDVVVSNAGVSVPRAKTATVFTLESIDFEEMLAVNVVGAARVIRYFGPLIRSGGLFATITSEAGSIENAFSSMPGYAISKAAQNKLVSVQQVSTQGHKVLAIHPGRVDTDMGRESAQISPEVSAAGIRDIITGVQKLPADEWFVNYLGEAMSH